MEALCTAADVLSGDAAAGIEGAEEIADEYVTKMHDAHAERLIGSVTFIGWLRQQEFKRDFFRVKAERPVRARSGASKSAFEWMEVPDDTLPPGLDQPIDVGALARATRIADAYIAGRPTASLLRNEGIEPSALDARVRPLRSDGGKVGVEAVRNAVLGLMFGVRMNTAKRKANPVRKTGRKR